MHPFGDSLRIVDKFPSRKNNVYLVERDGKYCVMKLYASDRYVNEHRVLSAAYDRGIPVPEPLDMKDHALLMQYIAGPTVNDCEREERYPGLVLGVASWLARFHRAFATDEGEVLLKSDAIFKNFIVSDRIYGIDFELSRTGRPEDDVGEAISFLLDTHPMFTEDKYRLARSFIGRYEAESGIQLRFIEDSIAKSLIEAAGFRPGQREVLLKKAKDLIVLKPFSR
jgi:tRNA A-37 threonylcarbamoyl transferase component Bud32